MPDNVVVVIILAVLCGTAVLITGLALFYCYLTSARRMKGDPTLRQELQGMRAELEQLRRQNNDVILSFDHTLQRLEQRMSAVEDRALPVPSQPSEPRPAQIAGRQF